MRTNYKNIYSRITVTASPKYKYYRHFKFFKKASSHPAEETTLLWSSQDILKLGETGNSQSLGVQLRKQWEENTG